MENTKNINNSKELQKIINNFNFIPARNKLVVTLNLIETEGKIIEDETAMDSMQWVVSAGNTALYKPGNLVLLDIEKMTIQQRSTVDATNIMNIVKFVPYEFEGRIFAIIDDTKILGKIV